MYTSHTSPGMISCGLHVRTHVYKFNAICSHNGFHYSHFKNYQILGSVQNRFHADRLQSVHLKVYYTVVELQICSSITPPSVSPLTFRWQHDILCQSHEALSTRHLAPPLCCCLPPSRWTPVPAAPRLKQWRLASSTSSNRSPNACHSIFFFCGPEACL